MVYMFFDIFLYFYQFTSNTIETNLIELNGTYLSPHYTHILLTVVLMF